MKAYDMIKKTELDVSKQDLIDLMNANRQIDLKFSAKKTDDMGYLTWDAENWSSVDGRRFIRCYSLEGRVLRDSTTHNIYDLENDFFPEEAERIEIN